MHSPVFYFHALCYIATIFAISTYFCIAIDPSMQNCISTLIKRFFAHGFNEMPPYF